MPRTILYQLVFFFLMTAGLYGLVVLIVVGHSAPEQRLIGLTVRLGLLNLFALVLTYALVRDRRWRVQWRALRGAAPELFGRLDSGAARRDPKAFLNSDPYSDGTEPSLPVEPPTVYLETKLEPLLRWNTEEPIYAGLKRPDVEEYLAVRIFELLSEMKLEGSYIGQTYHNTSRGTAVTDEFGDQTRARALRTVRHGEYPMYTFRLDRGAMHLTANFAVQRNGNIVTVAWYCSNVRATALDALRYSKWWSALTLVGILFFPLLLPVMLLYALVYYPPGFGWTSMWARVSRDRLKRQFGHFLGFTPWWGFGASGESFNDQREREAFEQNVFLVFRKLQTEITRW